MEDEVDSVWRLEDLQLGLHVAGADLVREALDVRAVVGEEDLLTPDEEVQESHVERTHLGSEEHGVQPLLDRQQRTTASRKLSNRVGLGAQALVQLRVDGLVHGIRAVEVASVHVQDRSPRTPSLNPLLDNL